MCSTSSILGSLKNYMTFNVAAMMLWRGLYCYRAYILEKLDLKILSLPVDFL